VVETLPFFFYLKHLQYIELLLPHPGHMTHAPKVFPDVLNGLVDGFIQPKED